MRINKSIDFLIVGAQKAGTSALDQYFRNHPEINMGRRKEIHFFDNEKLFKNSTVNYDKYHDFFDWSDPNILLGECTPNYMYWEPSMRRVFEYKPQIKIIACLRNPVDRAFSSWSMEKSRNNEFLSFSAALSKEAQRYRSRLPLQNRNHSYVDRGFYSEQVRRIWRYFPVEQTLFIKYDDLLNQRTDILQKISSFLNISEFPNKEFINVNPTQYQSDIDEQDRKNLIEIFQHEIRQLELMLGWDCSSWLIQKT